MMEDNQDIIFEEEEEEGKMKNTITESPIVFTEDTDITGDDEIDIDEI